MITLLCNELNHVLDDINDDNKKYDKYLHQSNPDPGLTKYRPTNLTTEIGYLVEHPVLIANIKNWILNDSRFTSFIIEGPQICLRGRNSRPLTRNELKYVIRKHYKG